MSISVKFFASLKEQQPDAAPTVEGAATVAEVWQLATRGQPMPDHVLCSVNLEHRQPPDAVADGDEVAFFPPVTGG
jgi:molybdopterin synthase sulfur carrier subunit